MNGLTCGGIVAVMALAAVACDSDRRMGDSGVDGGTAALDAGHATDAGPRPTVDSGSVDDAGAAMDASASSDAGASSDATSPSDADTCIELPETGSIGVTGELSSSSVRWRLADFEECPSELDLDTYYYVEATVLCNRGATGTFSIKQQGEGTGPLTLIDPFLTIYAGAGIPEDATMCIAINDDDPDGSGYDSKVTLSIDMGTSVTAAASQYEEIGWGDEGGTYRLVITRL